uniref:Uncharacterized protein n=1 Tax=Euplotes harpa TaxID=151035 RepID=A0A7S3JLJ7_9SPIT|mmetsp:Transcript_7528/g.8498  ORF Transcript_7528/g.8498 Transcript_7528/m.8498 type:complete len:190 (+) Transcript_7528:52-621(+)|eukprot:CAMPEP_0168343638 /NCGR_PEP_ID=MMETSP0213-20121227/16250_1 /TAXON_ID=151035 /ORGANISM="Euplotes harpa, Strain FSP1.4" /LENGTH=189 /DNA_ID=CAMNT_0008351047 /DNA_START=50 /DNA_END=619 /DNA_ORIENTATION=+
MANCPFEHKSHKHLRAIKKILSKPKDSRKESSNDDDKKNFSQMIDNKKRLIYCKRRMEEIKKSIYGTSGLKQAKDLDGSLFTTNFHVRKLENELKELEPKVALIPFTSQDEINEEIKKLEDGFKDRILDDDAISRINELQDMANTLKRWENKSLHLTNLKEEIEENKLFLQYTEDAISRLQIRQNFLMK